MRKYAKYIWIGVGVVTTLIGLAGMPDDLATWAGWIDLFLSYVDQDILRWLFVVAGFTILLLTSNFPSKLSGLRRRKKLERFRSELKEKAASERSRLGLLPRSNKEGGGTAKTSSPHASASSHGQTFIDHEKIKFIDTTYKQIRDECIPAYDQACVIAGSWRQRILENGPILYSGEVRNLLSETSRTIRDLARMVEDNRIFHEVFAALTDAPGEHNKMINALREFEALVKKLPEKPDNKVLDLIETQAQDFNKAVGQYGQWFRERLDILVEMRRAEIERKW